MNLPMADSAQPQRLSGARLPRWLLPQDWPADNGQPQVADICIGQGRIVSIAPHRPGQPVTPDTSLSWHLEGALVLPALVDAHTHLDKAFTLPRMGRAMLRFA